MELVEGQTLRERLDHGALPLQQALTYAIQIADALGAATIARSSTAISSRRTSS